jgi:hypothetical protein
MSMWVAGCSMPLWEQSWQVERRSAETKSGEGEGIVHVEADGKAHVS